MPQIHVLSFQIIRISIVKQVVSASLSWDHNFLPLDHTVVGVLFVFFVNLPYLLNLPCCYIWLLKDITTFSVIHKESHVKPIMRWPEYIHIRKGVPVERFDL